MTKTILVTGATGQVGRRVAELLSGQGHTLRLMTRDPRRGPRLPNAQAVAGDYSDPSTIGAVADGLNRYNRISRKGFTPDSD